MRIVTACVVGCVVGCVALAGVASAEDRPRGLARANGTYAIEARVDGNWCEAGSLVFDRFTRTRTLALGRAAEGAHTFRLTESGGGATHVDCVMLDGGAPVAVEGAPLAKLRARDDDVVPCKDHPLEVTFATPARVGSTIALSARIERERIPKTPFIIPAVNTFGTMRHDSAFLTYVPGASPGRLTLDGEIADEGLGEPFFDEFMRVGSGHPQARMYGWVMDDGETLYVALDFCSDNTMDGDKDYASVYVRTPDGVREHCVRVSRKKWGVAGFTYTSRVAYQHKVYEFAIPLEGLPRDETASGGLGVAFALYGTSLPAYPPYRNSIAYNPTSDKYLIVTLDATAQMLTKYRAADGAAFDIYHSNAPALEGDESVACNPNSGQFLIAWAASVSTDYYLFARRFDATGAAVDVSSDIQVSTTASVTAPTGVSLAVDTTNDHYLIVWVDSSGRLKGQIVAEADGSLVAAGEIDVSGAGTAISPWAAYDSTHDRYLVTWHDASGCYARYVSNAGVPEATLGIIAIAGVSATSPCAAYDPVADRFLIAYGVADTNVTRGALLDAAGTLSTPAVDLMPVPSMQSRPWGTSVAIAYSPSMQNYVLATGDGNSGSRFYWRFIDTDGTPLGSAVEVVDNCASPVSLAASTRNHHAVVLDSNGSLTVTNLIGNAEFVASPSSGLVTGEDGTADTFEVMLATVPSADVIVDVSSEDAGEGVASPAQLTFTTADAFDPQTVTVTGQDDGLVDGDVAYQVRLSLNSTSDTRYQSVADALVDATNADGQPTISIDDVTQAEGDAGQTTFTFAVTLSNAYDDGDVSVDWDLNDGTAEDALGDGDYDDASGTVTVTAGATTGAIDVAVNAEATWEADETFTVDLSGPVNATIADAQGLGTIQNDDATPAISIDDVALDEGDAGATDFVFTVSLSNPSSVAVGVDWEVTDGTAEDALGDGDYVDDSDTLSFAPGVTSQQVTVQANGDAAWEDDETFTVDLSGPVNATIADAQGLGTIQNDDAAPPDDDGDGCLPGGGQAAPGALTALAVALLARRRR